MNLKQFLARYVSRKQSGCSLRDVRRSRSHRRPFTAEIVQQVQELESRVLLTLAPGTLLIYYSYPSLINSSNGNLNAAETEFAKYQYVVLGDTLEHSSHPDHANTQAIVTSATTANTTFFGYVDLGVSTQNLSSAKIHTDIDEWIATGVKGIFLDDFGYDFGTSRARQNDAVDYAHSKGLPVVANGFLVDDVFSSTVNATYNPTGVATHLAATDFYLYEDYQITSDVVNYPGGYIDGPTWRLKADALAAVRATLPIQVLTVTVTNNTFDSNQFNYAWYSTVVDGYTAFGWGEPDFSSSTASAPFHTRPTVNLGNVFTSSTISSPPFYSRDTDTGRITVNSAAHSEGFDARPVLTGTSSISYFANQSPTAINTVLTVADADNSTLSQATITITNNVAGQDVLGFTAVPATMGNVSLASNSNGTMTLSSSGAAATLSQWQAALRSVTYSNSSNNPTTTARSIQFSISDGTIFSSPVTSTVNIGTLNHAPLGTTGTVTGGVNTNYTLKAADFGFSDPNDSPPNSLLAVKFTLLASAGTLKDNGVAVSVNQLVTAADINSGKLTFTPAANLTGGPFTVCKFQVEDNGGTANGGSNLDPIAKVLYVKLVKVNHAPVGTTGTIAAAENAVYKFKSSDFGFTDPNDSPANTLLAVKFTLFTTAGTLKDNGVAVSLNQFVTAADITAGKLTFTPATNLTGGPFTICKFQVQDNGGTANGGSNLDPSAKTMYVNLSKVNRAPSGTTGTVSTTKNTAYKLKATDFGFTDPNDSPPNTLLAVKFTLLGNAGQLTDNGVTVTANQFVTVADINAGKLVFTPGSNLSGGPFFLCKFQVEDNGGTANGGVNLDPTPKILYVRIN